MEREDSPARRCAPQRHALQARPSGRPAPGHLHADAVQQRHVLSPGELLRPERLRVCSGRRTRPRQLGRRVSPVRERGPRRARRGGMAGPPTVVQREGGDVGRLVCGPRPVDHPPAVPASPLDHRSRRCRGRRYRLPRPEQHPVSLSRAVADLYQRGYTAAQPVQRLRVLGVEVPGALPLRPAVQGVRPDRGKLFAVVPACDRAPDRRPGVESHAAGTHRLRADDDSNPQHHRSLRRRPAWRDALLPFPHGARDGGGQGPAFPGGGALGSRRHPHAQQGRRRPHVRSGQPGRPQRASQGLVRLDDEGTARSRRF